MANDKDKRAGVSTALNAELMRGGVLGATLRIECVIHKIGKYVAFMSCRFVDEQDRTLAVVSHTKFFVETAKL